MFNLGNDDKEKLKENMEEIKDLVNSDQDYSSIEQQKPDFSQMNQEAAMENTGQEPQQQSFTQENSENLEDEKDNSFTQSQSLQKAPKDNPQQENNKQNNKFSSYSQPKENDHRQNKHPSEGSGVKDSSPRERKPSRELDDTDHNPPSADFSAREGDSETIFLTVEHFEEVQERVKEMRNISNEIEDVMDHLETGVTEDEHTESEARHLLEDFSNRRSEIEEIVLSKKE